jgi:hypothetical protein
MRRREEPIIELPQGSLGAAAMVAFNMTSTVACLVFSKGGLRIDRDVVTARHLRMDAEPFRGRYMHFHGRQALLVGHALVRDDEQLELDV